MTLQNHLFHTLFNSSSGNTPENFCTVPLIFFLQRHTKVQSCSMNLRLLRIKKEVPSFRFTLFEVSRCMNSNVFWSICRVNFMQKSFLSLSSKKWVALPSLFSYSSKTLTGIPSKKKCILKIPHQHLDNAIRDLSNAKKGLLTLSVYFFDEWLWLEK